MSLANDQSSDAASESQLKDLKELVTIIEQKQRFQELVHSLTEICWDTCMAQPSTRLDDKTSNCMVNCVERFIDTTNFVSNRLKYAVNELMERKHQNN